MSDFGLGTDDYTRQAMAQLMAAQQGQRSPLALNGSPIGAPVMPGQFPGLVDPDAGGKKQGAPAGSSGGMRGLLDRMAILQGGQQAPQLPFAAAQAAQPGSPGLSQPNFNARFAGAQPSAPPVAPQPPPQMPQATPAAATQPGPTPVQTTAVPPLAGGPAPGVGSFAPPVPPQPAQSQPPPVPPSSAAGRVAQTQGQQANPLDQYFQQMMALQRQRMLFGMAGGLLGAPSLGIGLGRAFTNASETAAPQGDLLSKIAGAQAAGQLAGQRPYANKDDVQAAQLQALFGKPWEPNFNKFEHNGRSFITSPGGRAYEQGSGRSAWVFEHMGQDQNGNAVPIEQAATKGNGRYIRLDDGKLHDTQHPTFEGSEAQ